MSYITVTKEDVIDSFKQDHNQMVANERDYLKSFKTLTLDTDADLITKALSDNSKVIEVKFNKIYDCTEITYELCMHYASGNACQIDEAGKITVTNKIFVGNDDNNTIDFLMTNASYANELYEKMLMDAENFCNASIEYITDNRIKHVNDFNHRD